MNSKIYEILTPRSIAIVGASDDPARIGGRPIANLLQGGFKGPIYAVNPNRSTVQGLSSYARLEAVPGPVDLVIVALPAAAAVEAVRSAAAAGARGAVVLSAGFAESGAEGEALQVQLAEIVRTSALRLLGPNCLGFCNRAIGVYATFSSSFEFSARRESRIAFISQSGAFGAHMNVLMQKRGLAFEHWITTGNEVDLDLAELLVHFAGRDDVDIIQLYIEGVRDGARFRQGLQLARDNGKRVIVFKVGRTEAGAAAAATRTASLVGSDDVYDMILRQHGAVRARTIEELLDVTYACARAPLPRGANVGLLTLSGGVGAHMADLATEHGLNVPALAETEQAALRRIIPFAAVRNPVDVTGQAMNDMSTVARFLQVMLASGRFDAMVLFFSLDGGLPGVADKLHHHLRKGIAGFDLPIYLCVLASTEQINGYEEIGLLVFEDPARALAALRSSLTFSPSPSQDCVDDEPNKSARGYSHTLDEAEAKQRLRQYGLPFLDEVMIDGRDANAAVAAAERIGYPVALKVVSPDIAHKMKIGGVRLGIADEADLRQALAEMQAALRRSAGTARIRGYLISPMLTGGIETIVGARRDPTFGMVVTFGLGGIHVEVLRDIVMRICPVDLPEAREMIAEAKAAQLLMPDGRPTEHDIDGLASILVRLSQFADENSDTVESVELNPLLVRDKMLGCVALDALIAAR